MLIRQKRVRKLESVVFLKPGSLFVPGVELDSVPIAQRRKVGFSDDPEPGEQVLPSALGPITYFNAEGRYVVRKDLPMETAYRMAEWHWTQWHGRDTVERSSVVDVPYKRYPRTFVEPPSVELAIADSGGGKRYIIGPTVEVGSENALHVVNVFLELFCECEVLTADLEALHRAPLRRVNWDILPKGKHPWQTLKQLLDPIIREAPEGNQPVIEYRLRSVDLFGPEFVAVGRGGFRAYMSCLDFLRETFMSWKAHIQAMPRTYSKTIGKPSPSLPKPKYCKAD